MAFGLQSNLHTVPPYILCILILPQGQPIMNIEINCSQRNILISMIIMGCPGGKINMAAASAKRSMCDYHLSLAITKQMEPSKSTAEEISYEW